MGLQPDAVLRYADCRQLMADTRNRSAFIKGHIDCGAGGYGDDANLCGIFGAADHDRVAVVLVPIDDPAPPGTDRQPRLCRGDGCLQRWFAWDVGYDGGELE